MRCSQPVGATHRKIHVHVDSHRTHHQLLPIAIFFEEFLSYCQTTNYSFHFTIPRRKRFTWRFLKYFPASLDQKAFWHLESGLTCQDMFALARAAVAANHSHQGQGSRALKVTEWVTNRASFGSTRIQWLRDWIGHGSNPAWCIIANQFHSRRERPDQRIRY